MLFHLQRANQRKVSLRKARHLQSAVFILFLIVISPTHAIEQSPHKISSQINLLSNFNNDDTSWLDGGFGRYPVGREGDDLVGSAELHLGYRYKISDLWNIRAHLQAQESTQSNSATLLGVVELNAHYQNDIDWNQSVEVTLGQFFLPISMENTNRFWESPYTIHFSSLNSWIGEEFRPIGMDVSYHYLLENNHRVSVSSTLFGGNDSMGALLAYRGWSRNKKIHGWLRGRISSMLGFYQIYINLIRY